MKEDRAGIISNAELSGGDGGGGGGKGGSFNVIGDIYIYTRNLSTKGKNSG